MRTVEKKQTPAASSSAAKDQAALLPVRSPITSLRRSRGNRVLQSRAGFSGALSRVQRVCACGGRCSACASKDESLQKLQAKLTVGPGQDMHEQEADRVADQVMRMPERSEVDNEGALPALSIQRISSGEGGGFDPGAGFSVNQGVGQPLSPSTRRFMEPRFGADFGEVRVHTGAAAETSAAKIQARAYTYGSDITLGKGASENDTRLMAHELTHVVQQGAAQGAPVSPFAIQRYTQQDCDEALDLRPHIWPADHIARQMVRKAIRVLSMTPIDPAVTPLFSKNFMTATPAVATIKDVFTKIEADFSADNYQYECEDDCDDINAYVYQIWTDIHLCMNMLRGRANDCFASTIVHEFCHYSANLDDEAGRCYGCGSFPGCPASLSASDALDNADSYASFAYEIYPMSV